MYLTSVDYLKAPGIHHLLEIQADRRPDAIAIAAPERTPLSFHRLLLHAKEVVQTLNALGIGRNDRVAVVAPNGPEMASAFLTISSGATFGPLNPAYRANEFDFLLSDLQAKALIVHSGTDSPAIAVAQNHRIPIIELSPGAAGDAGTFSLRGQRQPAVSPGGFAQAEDVALILYTSGTTSRPKMVPLTHSNLLASAGNISATLELTEVDRCLNVMPLFHIHGLVGAVLSSAMAGCSVICTSGFDPERFFAWLEQFRPTWYTAVPTMHQAVLSCALANSEMLRRCPLRFIRSSSAPLPLRLIQELEEVFRIPVIEAYGMTEASHQIASNRLPPRARKPGSVGLAAGAEVAVMDEEGNLVTSGEVGEIVIRGPNVMSGYGSTREVNEESFAQGWFRTGDVGYLDEDEYLFLTGRLKEIINRGGEKISPEEVDEVLKEHPAVSEAVTFAVPHATLGQDVAAAIVLRENNLVTGAEIQRFAATRLAEFKVPRQVLIVSGIPRGSTGKIQRIGLAERIGLAATCEEASNIRKDFAPPQTPGEVILARIWSRVLGVDVGVHDNFFRLGGDSIHAARIISRMRESMGANLSFRAFFETPTVVAMAKTIKTAHRELPSLKPLPLPDDGYGPLSYAQEALWFLAQLEPGNPAYNRPLFLRLRGKLDLQALERSLNEIVRRHAVLRASFPAVDGVPVQRVAPAQPFSLSATDISNLPEIEREARARTVTSEEARRPFELARGPLLRASLLRLEEQSHLLLITTHHIVSDGWTSELVLRELAILYEAFSADRPSPLPELSVQYLDFARWQRDAMQDESAKNQLVYWKRQLAGDWPILGLPTDRPRPPVESFNGAHRSFMLPKDLSNELKILSRQEGATLFMTLLAAFNTLLYRYSGREDLMVGTPFAGRNQIKTEELMGLFINTLPLRTDLSGNPTFRELLARVRRISLEAHAHQDIPFEKIVAELQLKRDSSRRAMYEVLFQLRNYPRHVGEIGDLVIDEYEPECVASLVDISLAIREEKDGLECRFDYSTDLFEAATIERMGKHFRRLLEGVVVDPSRRLSDLPILTEAERQQLLVEWNDTKRDYPKDKCIHELFEAQVERSPDAVAVVFEDKHLTYRELNQRANQLAHHLRKLGVGPEVLVGICMERSLEMVVGLFGILKAGGAYVPLDPTYPKERLAFMLEDTQAPVLLTQERLIGRLPEHKANTTCLGTDWEVSARESGENLVPNARPENLVYVIYTSGSTGRPKGVLIEHQQILNYVKGIRDRFNLEPGAASAMVQPLSFDSSQTVIFPSLISGGCLHVISEDKVSDPQGLSEYFCHFPIDLLKITPSHLAGLQTASHPERIMPRQLLVLGGEASRSHWVATLQGLAPNCTIVNHYGPTEATVAVLTYSVDKNRLPPGSSTLPLGRPLANTQIYLLDQNLQPVPIGLPGELHIGGDALARGYLNRPDLTAENFIPNPFSDKPGARLYKTGDLARYLPDGNIEFLGRMDYQVKIRGFRIELDEIEAVLGQHPAVRETVVIAREDTLGSRRLIAYIVPRPEHAPTIAGRQRYRLPNNLTVAHLNKSETDYLYSEIFERQAYLKHGITLNDEDCVFDVGANIGLFVLFVNQICKSPRVYAFEPNPIAFKILSANASLYGSEVKLLNYGLSNEIKTAPFTFFQGFSLLSGFYAHGETEKEVVKTFILNQRKAQLGDIAQLIEQADDILRERFVAQTFTGQLRTLSSVIEEEGIQCIDLLKINVEKSELDVLMGIKNEDWKRIKQIVLEVDVKENLDRIVPLLERQGYDYVVEQDVLLENTQLRYIYAIRPSLERMLIREQADGTHIRPLAVHRDSLLSIEELQGFLSQKLPTYMMPSSFVFLDALPLTPNGKVDRRALPAPDQITPGLTVSTDAPRTPVEEVLAGIWAEVLKLGRVGVHDNFFDLGGDSILSIQIVARANQAGLRLTPKQLFQNQTIAELAAVAGTTPVIQTEQGLVTGQVPLTPIQRWFFEQNLGDHHHWNMAMLLEVRQALDPILLEQAVQRLLLHHDALRLRFTRLASGWQQVNAGPDETVPLLRVDLSALSEKEQGLAIEAAAAKMQASLNLSEGPLLRVALFDLGPHELGRLLIVIHHLAVDGVSWRILLEDLWTTYKHLSGGQVIKLPAKTTSFKQWAEALTGYARSRTLPQELAYWLAQPRTRIARLPADYPRGATTVASLRTVSVSLSVEETHTLLHTVLASYHAQTNDVLLTALLLAFTEWTGEHSLLVDLEGHGREAVIEEVDLSRTVGCFTTIFPVLLQLGEFSNPEEALRTVKEQLRRVPNQGIGYGLLRYLSEESEIAEKLQARPNAEVIFNYLGQFDQILPAASFFQLAREFIGPTRSLRQTIYLIQVTSFVAQGQFQMRWVYSEGIHRHATIEDLAGRFVRGLQSLITRGRLAKAGAYTPSDFPEAGLSQRELDNLIAKLSQSAERESP